MSFRSDFVASPETFMLTNIVKPQFLDGSGVPQESRPLVVTIREQTSRRCSKKGGKVYHLSSDTAGLPNNEKLPIYWLAYKQNSFTLGTLNNQSRYMFTAQMDGCSLGFGSQSGDGACLVSHANLSLAAEEGGRDGQRVAQHQQLAARFGGARFSVIEPDSYQATTHGRPTFKATNFGRNVSGVWQFYSHRYMDSGGTAGVVLHGGVAPAVSIAG